MFLFIRNESERHAASFLFSGPQALDARGRGPLHLAVDSGRMDVVHYLLDAGANKASQSMSQGSSGFLLLLGSLPIFRPICYISPTTNMGKSFPNFRHMLLHLELGLPHILLGFPILPQGNLMGHRRDVPPPRFSRIGGPAGPPGPHAASRGGGGAPVLPGAAAERGRGCGSLGESRGKPSSVGFRRVSTISQKMDKHGKTPPPPTHPRPVRIFEPCPKSHLR